MRKRIDKLCDMLTPTKDSTPIQGWFHTTDRVRIKWRLPLYDVVYQRRADNAPMGPFGGGWDWQLGVQRGSKEWYFTLIRFSVMVNRR